MANYVIFNQNNDLIKIAESDAEKDLIVGRLTGNPNVQTVSDSDFPGVKDGTSSVSFDGTNVTITPIDQGGGIPLPEDADQKAAFIKDLEFIRDDMVKDVEQYLSNNSDATWSTWVEKAKAIDFSNTANYPYETIEKFMWASDAGMPQKSILQLP